MLQTAQADLQLAASVRPLACGHCLSKTLFPAVPRLGFPSFQGRFGIGSPSQIFIKLPSLFSSQYGVHRNIQGALNSTNFSMSRIFRICGIFPSPRIEQEYCAVFQLKSVGSGTLQNFSPIQISSSSILICSTVCFFLKKFFKKIVIL